MPRTLARLLPCLLALGACSDPSGRLPVDAGTDASGELPRDAAVLDAGTDAPADAPPPDAPPIDAPPAPDPDAPRIDDVLTSDGFAEIRQGEAVELVIQGARFTGVTEVTLGAIAATVIEATDATLRVHVELPHGFAPQTLTLKVTTPLGTTQRTGAIAATPYTVAATAAAGGHGTAQSPLDLCDAVVRTAEPGDTIEIGPGTFRCAAQLALHPGVSVRGAGLARTELNGFGGFLFEDSLDPRPSKVAALTVIDASGPAVSIGLFGGNLEIHDLAVRGAADGIQIDGSPSGSDPVPSATIDHLVYTGTGTAISAGARLTVTASELTGCVRGISLSVGELTVRGSQITQCSTGILFGDAFVRDNSVTPPLRITDTTITGATIGVLAHQADATLIRTQIIGGADCQRGATLEDGILRVTDHSRIACAGFGVEASGQTQLEDGPSVTVADSEIVGGTRGVSMGSANDPANLEVRRSHIHGGSFAAVTLGDDDVGCDLGTEASPGASSLTSDTGFAFRDLRADPGFHETTPAHGTTLNGHDHAGQTITGPASLGHDYTLAVGIRLVF